MMDFQSSLNVYFINQIAYPRIFRIFPDKHLRKSPLSHCFQEETAVWKVLGSSYREQLTN